MLLILRRTALLDHLPPAIAAAALANAMRAHQLITCRARNQCRGVQALVLAAIATAVARNFCFWCGTHCCILNPFLALVVAENAASHSLLYSLCVYPSRLFKTSNRSSSSSSWQPQSPRFRSAPQFGQSPLQSGRQNGCIGSSSSAYSRISSPTSSR